MKKQSTRKAVKVNHNSNSAIVAPRGKKSCAPVVIRILLARKNKVVSIASLQSAVTKAKGRKTLYDGKKLAKVIRTTVAQWAARKSMKLKATSKTVKLAA